MRFVGVAITLLSVCATVQALPQCPSYDLAAEKVEDRVAALRKMLVEASIHMSCSPPTCNSTFQQIYNLENQAARGALPSTSDLALALTNLVVSRAKTEAQMWLSEALTDDLCKEDSVAAGYFVNTCRWKDSIFNQYGPSTHFLASLLKRDLHSLPACSLFRNSPKNINGNTLDYDAYVLQAIIANAYILRRSEREEPVEWPKTPAPASDAAASWKEISNLLLALILDRRGVEVDEWYASVEQDEVFTSDILRLRAGEMPVSTIMRMIKTHTKPVEGADKWTAALEKIDSLYTAVIHGDYIDALFYLAEQMECGTEEATNPRACGILPIAIEIVGAQTPEELEAAFDQAIAPLGTWRRKQVDSFWSMTAMVGGGVGAERLLGAGNQSQAFTSGLFVPVGIEHTRPVSLEWVSYVGIHLSMLDLGALATFSSSKKVEGGESETSSSGELASLVSPGINGFVGIRRTPFRFGLGLSQTPKLRSIKFDGDTEEDVDSIRLLAFFAADVTLFPF